MIVEKEEVAMELDQKMRSVICAEKGEETFDFLRDFALHYTGMSAIMRRRMTSQRPDTPKLRYHSIEECILFNGTMVEGDAAATPFPAMIMGNCFANAFELTMRNPELTYCEGWATMERSIPTHHAWAVGPDGSIHDPTWKSLALNEGMERVRCIYHGVSIPRTQHAGYLRAEGDVNILYSGEMFKLGVLEHGLDYYKQFDLPDLDADPEIMGDILDMIENHGSWSLEDRERQIFVHTDGRRWCGKTSKFIEGVTA